MSVSSNRPTIPLWHHA